MRFRKCTYGDLLGNRLYAVGEVYGALGVIGGLLYEVWEVYGDPRGP